MEEPVPAQIKSFIDLSESEFLPNAYEERLIDFDLSTTGVELLQPMKYVIVQSALSPEEDSKGNNLYCISERNSKRFCLEKKWRILPVESIIGPLIVIQDTVSQNDNSITEYLVINNKATWYNSFLNKE